MDSRHNASHTHDDTAFLYATSWGGNVSADPTWVTDGVVILPIEALTSATQQLRQLLQKPACKCRGRASGDQVMERWNELSAGPIVRSPLELEYRFGTLLVARVGDSWYAHERLALLRAAAPADYFRSATVLAGSTKHLGPNAQALLGFRGEKRVWSLLPVDVSTCASDVGWTGRVA